MFYISVGGSIDQMKYFEHYLILDTNMLYELTREVPQELKKKYDLK